MTYANKSHVHRDEKNDYDRKYTLNKIEEELDYLAEHAHEISINEYKERVEAAGDDKSDDSLVYKTSLI